MRSPLHLLLALAAASASGCCVQLPFGNPLFPAGSPSKTSANDGGTVDDSSCLSSVHCASTSDCAKGDHCNLATSPPTCEHLYCGPEGSLCSETVQCQQGLECWNSECTRC